MYLITFDQITHIIIVFIKIWHILMSIYDWRLQPAEAEFVSGQAFAYFHQLLQFVLGMDAYTSWATVLDPQVNNIQHRVGNRAIRIPQLPWTMSTLRTSPSIEGLLLALRNGTSCAVSDGSFYPNEKVVAAAWIIITPDGTEWIEGGGVLPGPADVQNSYCSELGGQVGIVVSCLKSL